MLKDELKVSSAQLRLCSQWKTKQKNWAQVLGKSNLGIPYSAISEYGIRIFLFPHHVSTDVIFHGDQECFSCAFSVETYNVHFYVCEEGRHISTGRNSLSSPNESKQSLCNALREVTYTFTKPCIIYPEISDVFQVCL